MLELSLLQEIIIDNRQWAKEIQLVKRVDIEISYQATVLIGIRRSGKSYLLFQRMHELIEEGHNWDEILFVNFEDERLLGFKAEDFNRLLEAYGTLHPQNEKPWIFLDEIQNIDGWEKFARRLADQKYHVVITGSNAKMLSSEVATTLGGRYLVRTVFPFSFAETIKAHEIDTITTHLHSTETRSHIRAVFDSYLRFGGFPGIFGETDVLKRDYLNNLYQKIYLGDIATRNNINNIFALRLMIKKLAESVGQPVSYTRLTNLVTQTGIKLSKNTLINHVGFVKDAFLIFSIHNFYGKLNDRETNPKYYFADNGLIELLNRDPLSAQLENVVAIELIRRFGLDDRVFYFAHNAEIDFYVPEWDLGIQVTRDLNHNETMKREVGAFEKTNDFLSFKRRLILTLDDERTLETSAGSIEVMPIWKWLLTSEEDR